jgi:ubiquinone/menaquinone biosynthesis C-methylase UbiE
MSVDQDRPSVSPWRSQVLEAQLPLDAAVRRYSTIAPVYEIWARLTESHARRRVLELANVKDGESIVEVATGTGVQLVSLASRNPSGRTVGVELAEKMLAQTRKRLRAAGLGSVEVLRASALMLPFEDQSFDLVVNAYMLDLLAREDIPRALAEFKRILRPNGRLVLSNMTPGRARRHRMWDWLYAHNINLTANCRGVLAAPVLADLGFEETTREYMTQMLFPTEIVTARRPGAQSLQNR